MSEEENREKVKLREALEQFVKGDEPEMTQEEAIEKYQEIKKKYNNSDDDSDESTEEQEHLARIKQELLAALKRVENLEKELFGQKDKLIDEKAKLKVSTSKGGKSMKLTKEIVKDENMQKERE